MPALKHTHTYERLKLRPEYYRCTHPDCNHYIHKQYLAGKRAKCPYCGNEYLIESVMISGKNALKTLHCNDCTDSKKGTARKKVSEGISASKIVDVFTQILKDRGVEE